MMFLGLMIADTDMKSDEGWKHRKMTWESAWQECQALLRCQGAKVYCCAPLSCKLAAYFRNVDSPSQEPLNSDRGYFGLRWGQDDRPSSSSSPSAATACLP